MEISVLQVLLSNISSFLNLSSSGAVDLEPFNKYYKRGEETLKVVKPILDALANSEIVSDEGLKNAFEESAQYADESGELFRSRKALSSKVYFVLQMESLVSKMRSSVSDICQLLKSFEKHLPDELSSISLEHCLQKIKFMQDEQVSSTIDAALRDQRDGVGPSSEILVKIGENIGLRSNQEILIEAVALEKIKEFAEQAEKNTEVEFIDQLISLVTRMHDRLLLIKQTQTNSSVPILADFFCPLSLEVMTDPVIVASGQTYERACIRKWIDLGLTVCPKTRQPLTHSNLIPNYTVKALIANWCETNNVKLPDPTQSMSLSQLSPLLAHNDPGATRDSNVFTRSRSNQPMSTGSVRSNVPSSNPSLSSSGIDRDGSSLSGEAGNGHSLDTGRILVNDSEDRYRNNPEERKRDSLAQSSISSSDRKRSLNGTENGEVSQNHNRSTSVSSTRSNEDFPGRTNNDANENSDLSAHATPYSSDASGESGSHPAGAAASARQRDFSPRYMERRLRSQSIWRRPCERLIPRIISSSTMETRPDLSGLETQVKKLVEDLKGASVDAQREATSELRLLAKHNMDNRIVIANCGAISLLVDLLNSTDHKIQENAVTTLLNLSINDNNKTAIASAGAIEPLIRVLDNGSPEAKENSAATLFSLSVIEENKIKIGRSGAIEPLVNLLGNGTPRGKKDAATALFNLSIHHENKGRIVEAGAVRHLVELMDPAVGMVDKAVAVLANMATIPEGRTAIGQEGGIPLLVEVVELGSPRGKENAAAALLQLCTNSGRFCNMVLQEGAVPPLVLLSQSGTPRAREKAQALLSYFRNQRHGNTGRG